MTTESREQDHGSSGADRESSASPAHPIGGLSDEGLREKIARIVDPEAWDENFLPDGTRRDTEVAHIFADALAESLAKADAILALSTAPERVEGGGMDSASQSQPCAEKGPQPFSHDAPLSDGGGEA